MIFETAFKKSCIFLLKEAIILAKANNQMAFNYLLDQYWNDLYGFLLKRTKNENDAEDLSIESFSKAFDNIQSFNEDYNFKTWLFTISRNLHLDLVRKQKSSINRKTKDVANHINEIVDESPSPEDKLIKEQNLENLLANIKKLKPHYQQVIQLRYFQEKSYKEIATELDQPMNNIKVNNNEQAFAFKVFLHDESKTQ